MEFRRSGRQMRMVLQFLMLLYHKDCGNARRWPRGGANQKTGRRDGAPAGGGSLPYSGNTVMIQNTLTTQRRTAGIRDCLMTLRRS